MAEQQAQSSPAENAIKNWVWNFIQDSPQIMGILQRFGLADLIGMLLNPNAGAKQADHTTQTSNTQQTPETGRSAATPESGPKPPESPLTNKFQQHAHGALDKVYNSLGATANDTALKEQIDQLASSLGKLGLTESFNTEVNERLADIKLADLEPATIREAVTDIFNTHSDDPKAQTAALVALGETIHKQQNPEPANTPDAKLTSATP
jgi:hypothetical protein